MLLRTSSHVPSGTHFSPMRAEGTLSFAQFARGRQCHTGSQDGCANGHPHQLGDRRRAQTIRTEDGVRVPTGLEAQKKQRTGSRGSRSQPVAGPRTRKQTTGSQRLALSLWKAREPAPRAQLSASGRSENKGVSMDILKAPPIPCSNRGDFRQKSSVQLDAADHWGVTSAEFTSVKVICVKGKH